MIVEGAEVKVENPVEEKIQAKNDNFLEKLVWKESSYGKWHLGHRTCVPAEGMETPDPDIVTFDMGGYTIDPDEEAFKPGNKVFSELGKLEVAKVEGEEVFLKLEDGSEVPVSKESVKNIIYVNILILGKTKNHLIEKYRLNLNLSVFDLKVNLAEILTVTSELFELYHKGNIFETYQNLSSSTIEEGDTIILGFIQKEEQIYKRSTSRDYSWYDQKNFIPFIVDKNIQVSAFGFFKHTDSSPAIYDFFLYEVNQEGAKSLVLQMSNVKVLPSECDSSMYVKRVPCTPIILKENVKYYAYVYYKISDMRTYYAYYGSADQNCSGVRFRMLDQYEAGFKSSSTSGHMPYIYFRLYNPYDE